jgi:hypothetical protein
MPFGDLTVSSNNASFHLLFQITALAGRLCITNLLNGFFLKFNRCEDCGLLEDKARRQTHVRATE